MTGIQFLACFGQKTWRLASVNFSHVFKNYGTNFGIYDNWVEKIQIYTNEVGPPYDGSSWGSQMVDIK